jgi:hypothetical protein
LIESFDLSDKNNWGTYLDAVNQQRALGIDLSAQDISTSKALLHHYYGYAMGESTLGNTAGMTSVDAAARLNGSLDDQMSAGLERALNYFSGLTGMQRAERSDFYSNITVGASGGNSRSIKLTRDGRTVRIDWDKTFADRAGQVGVGADEALRKTDFSVYKAVADAAFATDGVSSLNISSAWRPVFKDFDAVRGMLAAEGLGGSARALSMATARPWSDAHPSARGVDINRINQERVNNNGFTNGVPNRAEPDIVSDYTDNLSKIPGRSQIIQPWRIWMKPGQVTPDPNTGTGSTQQGHANHLHYGR